MTEEPSGAWSEEDWLDRVRRILPTPDPKTTLVPVGDDAAVLSPVPAGKCSIVTVDAHVEGTHFRKAWLDWAGLARRAALSAASDITAMGGIPTGFLLSLGVPPDTEMADLDAFLRAAAELCREFDLVPLGGDTVRSERILVDVTVLGEAARDRILRQDTAEPGDALWISGELGRMRAAVAAQEDPQVGEEDLRDGFWRPPVRWPILEALREVIEIRAMTDLSDGLEVDLRKILRRKGLGAVIDVDRLPAAHEAESFCRRRGLDPIQTAYLGGEDFELLVVEKGAKRPEEVLTVEGVPLTRIGTVLEEGKGTRLFRQGKPWKPEGGGFRHFG